MSQDKEIKFRAQNSLLGAENLILIPKQSIKTREINPEHKTVTHDKGNKFRVQK